MIKYFKLIILISFFLFHLGPKAYSQETSASFDGGSVKVGYDTTACTGANEGAVRYNTTSDNLEFCDGADWAASAKTVAPSISLCAGVTDEDAVGDNCTDGSVYVGIIYDPGESAYVPLYAADVQQSTGSGPQWKTSSGVDDITGETEYNGSANTVGLNSAISNFPAFEMCANLNRHGHTDWYLPATLEIDVIFSNQDLIPEFTEANYWSSNQWGVNGGSRPNFVSGSEESNLKTLNNDVHCIRRD